MHDPRMPVAPNAPPAPGYGPAPAGTGAPAPLVPVGPPAPPGLGSLPIDTEAPGFGAGVGSLFSGLKFVTSTPSVWPLAMVPVFFFVVLTAAIGVAGAELLSGWITPMLGPWAAKGGGAVGVAVKVVVTVLSVVLGAVFGFLLAQPLSGPALEKIVRKVEGSLGAPSWPETGILADVWRSLEGLLLTTVLTLPMLAVLFAIELVFPPAAIVTMPLKGVVTALMLAWDLCDYPLSIRGMPIRARFALLSRNAPAVFGFGLGLALLSLIPCALLIALPVGAAGATRLIVRLERWETQQKLVG
jgi:CysZ protein